MTILVLAIVAVWVIAHAAASIGEASGSVAARLAVRISLGLALAASVLVTLAALFAFVRRCDENCDDNVVPEARLGRWYDSNDSWQWWGQLGLAAFAILAAGTAMYLHASGRARESTAVLAISLGLGGGWVALTF